MPRKASSERMRFWQELIRRHSLSGLSIARFCEQAGVSQNSFFAWKRRLRTDPSSRLSPSRQRRSAARSSKPKPKKSRALPRSLVPVRLVADLNRHSSPAGTIEVMWPNGVVLRVPPDSSAGTLRDVFGLLTSARDGEASSC